MRHFSQVFYFVKYQDVGNFIFWNKWLDRLLGANVLWCAGMHCSNESPKGFVCAPQTSSENTILVI